MRTLSLLAAGLFVSLFASSAAHAEAKKSTPASTQTVRYFQLPEDFLGDLTIDGFLKETRQAGRLTSIVIDVCHSVSSTSARKDRFVLTLKVEGARLTGNGQSQETKVPVAVNLVRKPAGKAVTLQGAITLADNKIAIQSNDMADMSESEFLENQEGGSTIAAEPEDFTEVMPGAIAVKIKRESIVAFVKEVRGQDIEIDLASLAPNCLALRSGEQEVWLNVDPARAAALIKKFKSVPGVVDVGWTTSDNYSIDHGVRVAAAAWRGSSGRFDKERLATAIASATGKYFTATVETADWNATTGELKVVLKRPSQSIPGLDLSDRIEVVLLVGPEKLASNTGYIIWLRGASMEVIDNGPEPRGKFANTTSEDSALIDEEQLLDALAADLKGKRWDSEQGDWQ